MTRTNATVAKADIDITPRSIALMGALGVVYGDIGTSPLYTIKAAMALMPGAGPEQILGLLSLLFWMLMLVVSLKYVGIILRANNRGEGGTLALLVLALKGLSGRKQWVLTIVGLIGACLFYGDSMITPAISVLSAIEGISLISYTLMPWVVPLSVLVLAALFLIQSHGTGTMGKLFGPIMLCWFLTLAGLGAWRIFLEPSILQALNPVWAYTFIAQAPWQTYLLLGVIVLALTGAEALYADMGHFGHKVISQSWFSLVLPALVLCYLGQGAVLLANPDAVRNPFFLMAPDWGLVPLVVLATLATVIASQSVISGAFSVTRQAVQLGFWPRMAILHTSASAEGQIYLPRVNQLLFVAVLFLVVAFGSSERLAHAYGFAVTGTMLMTSILAWVVLPRQSVGLRRIMWLILIGIFLLVDVLLFSSNALKVFEGGWLPLLVGLALLALMTTWKQGRDQMHKTLAGDQQPLRSFMKSLDNYPPTQVSGTAVFMTMIVDTVPPALLHNLKHNKVLHKQVLFLHVSTTDVPYVPLTERVHLQRISENSWQLIAHWGFKQEPDVPQLLDYIAETHPEIHLDPMEISYFLSHTTVIVVRKVDWLSGWRRRLFSFMTRNASGSSRFFKIPPNRVVEMGRQLEL
ncbi:potassium transporter Kup [Alcaligenaceae bacterium]|nr:potassium transporter Kup [Alcaligenaceae bacterium]